MTPTVYCLHDEMVLVSDLKDHPQNRNKHPKEQVERLAKLYSYHGIRHPIIVSKKSGYIVAGHGRKAAARKAGIQKMPVVYQYFEDDKAEYAFIQADNAIALWADLDVMSIKDDVKGLGDFDLELLGLKDFKIEELKEAMSEEDEVPEIKEPFSIRGDLYEIGHHRVLCGDSTKLNDVEKLMNGEKADMVFTDPPYGVSYTGGHNQKKRKGIENDTLEGESLTDLFYNSIENAFAFTYDHAAFYIWYANGKAVETFASFSKLPLTVRAVICWYKVKSGLGAFMSQYIPNYEPCIYAFKTGCSPQWFGPTDEKTVWELKKEPKNAFHPTQKPVELPSRAIENSSKAGQIILDLFGGSGSTLIASHKLDRKCYMMELDPVYTDVIVSRYCNYTGAKDVLRNGERIAWPPKAKG